MVASILPPNEELKYLFDFDFENGIIYWKNPSKYSGSVTEGDIAGYIANIRKYRNIKIFGKLYLAHRIIYSVYYDVVLTSDDIIDHRDGNPGNNKINNLRLCTQRNNVTAQHKLSTNNTSGHVNIISHTTGAYNYWLVKIQLSKTPYKDYTKYFNKDKYTIEDAIKHRDMKRKEFFGEYAGSVE